VACVLGATLVLAAPARAQTAPPPTQAPPVPKPFPQPGQPAGATRPVEQTPPQIVLGPDGQQLNVPVYPGAEFLEAFDAGQGQQYLLYGTNQPFATIVDYYKSVLKTGGRELFKAPAMQQFDLGKFQENSMVYPPSIVVKDYTWNGSEGYLFVDGVTSKRYRTIIQIVPPPPGLR
jgi:hypothetical protein